MKILIVDYRKLVLEALTIYLTRHGFDVTQATGPQQAFDLTLEVRPDVVVTATNFFVDMSGIELSRRIKEALPKQAIVGMSITMDEALEEEYKKVGVTDTWLIGSDGEDLIAAIKFALAISRTQ